MFFLGYETQRKISVVADTKTLDFIMSGNVYQLDAVEIKSIFIKSSRSMVVGGEEGGVAKTINHGQDTLFFLQWQPSVTTSNDAGSRCRLHFHENQRC